MPDAVDSLSCSMSICQNNGQCLVHNSSIMNLSCICTNCFTGAFCEIEKYSANLWQMGISGENRFKNFKTIEGVVGFLLAMASLLSNFLALQTFLCSGKIRITNLGVYLILLSLTSLILSIFRGISALIAVSASGAKLANNYNSLQCATMQLFGVALIICLFWLILFIAVERILIEHSWVSLYDSRRRAMISSLCIYSTVAITNITMNIFGTKGGYSSVNFCQLNFTPTGYILYSIFRWLTYLLAPTALLISSLFIFHHLLQHRRHFTNDSNSFGASIKLVASNHRDFILQPLLFTVSVMPNFILGQSMTCSKANLHFVGKLKTIFALLSDSALVLTFFTCVIPSKLYIHEFWNTSYVGRALLHMKDRSCTGILKKPSVFPRQLFETIE